MKITKKFTYALNIIQEVSLSTESVNSQTVATKYNLSQPFVTIIMRELRNSGILVSKKGPGGGYKLNKSLQSIKVIDLFNAVNEEFHQASLFLNESNTCKKFLEELDFCLDDVAFRPIEEFFRG
jgi:Rrf2 family protein